MVNNMNVLLNHNIMRNIKLLIVTAFVLAMISSCKRDEQKPIEGDKSAPAAIKNVSVQNLSGGAKITYSLPADPDLLYIQAIYKNQEGKNVEFKSSYYTNSITVEGFSDTTEHAVEVYAVDRSGNRSAAVMVTVVPKAPPVLTTYRSLAIAPDFGGIIVSFKNLSKADLAIVVTTPDSTGKMAIARTFYTARDSASFSLRGFPSEARKFGVYVRDKWGNTSEVLNSEITPIYEVQLDKKKFKEMFLPGDSPCTSWGGAMPNVWDGRVLPDVDFCCLHTGNVGTGIPKYVTFDMGVLAQLSRFSQQTVADDKHWYNDVSMKRYEIWGTDSYDPSGSFNGWTKLATVTNSKPSGLPTGLLTEDDRIAGRIGDEVNFPADIPKVRYIRIRCLDNWSGNTNMVISEVTFWGNDK
jgi:3D (Asp-Asp-Asp) domain-containing protein